jgi:phosphoglycerate kinase
MKTLEDFNFENKRVLVRCDFNVPLDEKGNILNDFRIKETIPTIEYLVEKEAKVILMSHLDDPGGRPVEKLRLDKVQEKLERYLNLSIAKAKDCIGEEIEGRAKEMQPGEISLLENLRFHKEEEANDSKFAKDLAKLGDIYINDAFGVSHRVHASLVGVPKYLPSGIGLLVEKEIKALEKIIKNPLKPLVAIIAGAKVETKIKLIDKISEITDFVLIGGLLNREIKQKNIQLKYPERTVGAGDGLDLKDEDIKLFKEKIKKAKTIFWNGPLGKTEEKEFQKGTKEIAEAIIESGAFSVVGGGETVEFINKIGLSDKFSHVSTGGGALLDFICDGELVALKALKQ